METANAGYLGEDEVTYQYLNADDREAIVLIHGWTNEEPEDAPANAYYSGDEWAAMLDALKERLSGSKIKVLPFHWENEASTGVATELGWLGFQGFNNATQAAKNAVSQGVILADSIHLNGPNLRKVTFVAHSAGTWVAYNALNRLLTLNRYVMVELVLLDPFIPGVDPSAPRNLTTETIDGLENENHPHKERIWSKENYLAYDITDLDFDFESSDGYDATSQIFSGFINLKVDYWAASAFHHYGDIFGSLPAQIGHSGPIKFYADTVTASTIGVTVPPLGLLYSGPAYAPLSFTDYGFFRSMTHQSYLFPSITSQPLPKTVQLGQIKASDFLSVTATRTTLIEWIRDSDKAVVGTGATLSLGNFTALDAGLYVAKLSNANATLYSDAVQVTVQSVPPPTPTRIITLSGDMTFGNVAISLQLISNLTVSNNGNSPLTVTALTLPSGFSYANVGVVPAGGSINIPIAFSPTAAQPYSGNITVASDKTSGTNTYAASGTGFTATGTTRLISVTGNMAFGSVVVGSNLAQTLTITNSGNSALSVTGITMPSGFSGNWSGSIASGGSQAVTVTFTPSSAANYSGNISIQSNATGGTASKAASGTGISTAPPPQPILALSSTLLAFNYGAGSGDLAVRNDGTGTMNWTASSNASWARVLDSSGSLSAGSGEWLGIAVDANPNTTARSATITVQAPGATGAPKTFTVTQTAQPVTRIISITGLANFEDTTPGISLRKTITVRNLGNTLLQVTGTTMPTGYSAYAYFNLASGDSLTVTVTFNPTVGGIHSGTMIFTSDATSGNAQVFLSGNSILPPAGMVWTRFTQEGDGAMSLEPAGTPFVQGTQLHSANSVPRFRAVSGSDYYIQTMSFTGGGPFDDWIGFKNLLAARGSVTEFGESVDQPFPILANNTVSANFLPKPVYQVQGGASSGGSISGQGSVKWGDTVPLVATPQAGFAFTGWISGAQAVSYDSAYAFRVFGNQSLTAGFVFDIPPLAPTGSLPATGAVRVPVKPTFSSNSVFQDPDVGDTFAASEWVVRSVVDGNTVYSSGRIAPSAAHTAGGALPYGKRLVWQVRHWDQKGGISPFSAPIEFETRPSIRPNPPTPLNPVLNERYQKLGAINFSAAFSDLDPEDSIDASQWIIRRASDSAVIHDSGNRNSRRNYYEVTLPLEYRATYSWQVRYKDSVGVWGDFSQPALFMTRPPERDTSEMISGEYFGTVFMPDAPDVQIGIIQINFRKGFPRMILNGETYISGGPITDFGALNLIFRARGAANYFNLYTLLPNHPAFPSSHIQANLDSLPMTNFNGPLPDFNGPFLPFAKVRMEQRARGLGKTNPSPFTGYYTIALPADPSRPEVDYPQGHGFAGVTVKPDGTARVVGVLGDGKPFTAAGALTTEGRLLIWTSPYKRKGTFGGWIQFTEGTTADAETVLANLTWTRPTAKKGEFFNGFTGSVAASGSRYTPPLLPAEVLGQPAMPMSVELDDGTQQTKQFAFPSAKSAVAKHSSGSSLKIAAKTGLFTGKFRTDSGKLLPYRGIMVQQEAAGFGLFKSTGNYGRVTVEKENNQ